MILDLALVVAGALAAMLGSQRAVERGVRLARALGLPPFLVGVVLLSLGTDLSEITNSIVSALTGHGDIAAGDAIGSVFTQGTLILGLLPFVVRAPLIAERRQVLTTCVLTLLGVGLSALLLSDGTIGRLDALVLGAAWVAATWILSRDRRGGTRDHSLPARPWRAAVVVLAWLALVAAGALAIVRGVAGLAAAWGVPEYVLSFLLASLGTSLPELVVDLTALRKGHVQLALGDLLGSCLVDATLVVGIGPLVRPTQVTIDVALRGAALAALGMAAVAGVCARGRIDRAAGAALLVVYLAAYALFLRWM
ncbi:MAG TPA: hypothetical protein VFD43_03255 [Planctomycetota bacterium]|nr:hypothetical protein [Planctomycetota bacterium]